MSTRKPQEIEREIEEERHALQRSLHELQAHFSPEAIVNQASGFVKTYGNDFAHSLGKQVRENPVPLALTAVGLVWLMAGSRNDGNRGVERVSFDHHPVEAYDPRARAAAGTPANAAYDTRTRPVAKGFSDDGTDSSFDARVQAADAELRRSRARGSRYDPASYSKDNGDSKMSDYNPSDYGHGTQSRGTWDTVKDRAQTMKTRAYRNAADLRARIEEGTSELPAAARRRIIQAREAALNAQEYVEAKSAELGRRAKQTSYENPLMVGAIAFAVGAAFGASLPRTSVENRALGAHRDRLFDEADRIFREETEKAKRVAETMVAEGQSVVKDALSNTSTESGKSAVSRISEAGKSEAKRQNLGDTN